MNLLPAVSTAAPLVSSNESQPKGSIDINSLLNNLLKVGLIKETQNTNDKPAEESIPLVQQPQPPVLKESLSSVKDAPVEKVFLFYNLVNMLRHLKDKALFQLSMFSSEPTFYGLIRSFNSLKCFTLTPQPYGSQATNYIIFFVFL